MSEGESITLRPQARWLPWVFAVLSTGATMGLAWGLKGEIMGWLTLLGFAGPVVMTGARFHPDCHRLKLAEEGMVVTRWFRSRVHGWQTIQGIEVRFLAGTKQVRVILVDPVPENVILRGDWQMSPDALAVLLRRWQARYGDRLQATSPSV